MAQLVITPAARKAGLLLVAVIMVLAAAGQYAVRIVSDRIGSSVIDVSIEERRLRNALLRELSREDIEAEYARLQPYINAVAGDEKQNIAQLLRELERIVNVSGGIVGKLAMIDRVVETEHQRVYRAEYLVECSFPQLLELLHGVQRSALPLFFETVSIIARDERADIVRVEGIAGLVQPK